MHKQLYYIQLQQIQDKELFKILFSNTWECTSTNK